MDICYCVFEEENKVWTGESVTPVSHGLVHLIIVTYFQLKRGNQ